MKLLLTMLIFTATSLQALASLPDKYVVVPNRSDSSITLISTPQGKVLKKISAQEVGFDFEPMYASNLPRFNMVSVGDRKNSRLLFFDNEDFRYLGSVPTSKGIFHMFPTPEQKEILVSGDIDRVVDLVEINRFGDKVVHKKRQLNPGKLYTTGKPHDVVVDEDFIFVTMIGIENPNGGPFDALLKYDRKNLKLLGQMHLSFDIHLGYAASSPFLLVPEQTAGRLNFVDKQSFQIATTVEDLPGAHGIYSNKDASRVFLGNFTSKGPMSVYEVQKVSNGNAFKAEKVESQDLMDAKAHNITVDFENQTLFVTHSGPNVDGELNTNVSVFSIKSGLEFIKTVETGSNPLGILLVER